MSQIDDIRKRYASGQSQRQIARDLHLARRTVCKYLGIEDFSPTVPISKPRGSKLDLYKPIIDRWLEEDRGMWHKQRHTAQRIFDRLRSETDFDGSYSIVQVYVRQVRIHQPHDAVLELVWEPGSAQIDFGEADFLFSGVKRRLYYLTVSFPFSNAGYTQVFSSTAAECVCQGLKDIFTHIGGVPRICAIDNATGVGRRIKEAVTLTELFSAFRLHHLFEVRFCNPDSAREKGNVEAKVGFTRRNLFVPMPRITDIEAYNVSLLERCDALNEREHYRKELSQMDLFAADRQSLLPLTARAFNVVRFESVKTDGYGKICLEGHHYYSTRPDLAGTRLYAGISAHHIQIIDTDGVVVATHPRAFAARRTDTIDPAASLSLLARRPGAWENSQFRASVPDAVRVHLDSLTRAELRQRLEVLAVAAARSGLDATLRALEMLSKDTDDPNVFDTAVLAGRISGWGIDVKPEDGPELSIYDEAFLAREVTEDGVYQS